MFPHGLGGLTTLGGCWSYFDVRSSPKGKAPESTVTKKWLWPAKYGIVKAAGQGHPPPYESKRSHSSGPFGEHHRRANHLRHRLLCPRERGGECGCGHRGPAASSAAARPCPGRLCADGQHRNDSPSVRQVGAGKIGARSRRSEEHTSELQSPC